MNKDNYTTTFLVARSTEEVFNAINNVPGWWSGEVAGKSDKLGAEFTYLVPDTHYSKQKVTEFLPGKMIIWHVSDATLSFAKNKKEWKETDIIFEITPIGDKTEVRFTHEGLSPTFDCYKDCSNGWNMLINNNLRELILTGKDQPSPW